MTKKTTLMLLAMLLVTIAHAQYLRTNTVQQAKTSYNNDTLIVVDTIAHTANEYGTTVQQLNTTQKVGYYQWENPLFGDINAAILDQYPTGSDAYMQQLQNFEQILKNNKELQKNLYSNLKSEQKLFKQDYRNWKEKRRFFREDEKLLKRERKLRERELKMIRKERKQLTKNAKKMDTQYVVYQNNKLDEREQRIGVATQKWNEKKETVQKNMSNVADQRKTLDERKKALKERKSALKQNDQTLKIQADIIKLKKKQAKLEIKKAEFRQKQQQK